MALFDLNSKASEGFYEGRGMGYPGIGWLNSRKFGIGGLLMDHTSRIVLKFSRSIGVGNSSLAQLSTIREAFQLFLRVLCHHSINLWIESDLPNAINWIMVLKLRIYRMGIWLCSASPNKLLLWQLPLVLNVSRECV
ncbi:Uncharacterized protein TCM_017472 [Theobroma cacao]|uniref:Uncharacterized protein n=1 Tax=Theobroma cacao TaxID=3641 RepID=A0A061EL64_THECC|nr:Uncharacterized protein TCM_017472 [Theobroma cacao]